MGGIYLLGSSAPLNLELELLYLNTSSIKSMMDIFDVLEAAHGRAARLASPGSTTCATSVGELAEEFGTFPFSVIGRQ